MALAARRTSASAATSRKADVAPTMRSVVAAPRAFSAQRASTSSASIKPASVAARNAVVARAAPSPAAPAAASGTKVRKIHAWIAG